MKRSFHLPYPVVFLLLTIGIFLLLLVFPAWKLAAFSEGFSTKDGRLIYRMNDGTLLTNTQKEIFWFDENGYCTTGDPDLDAELVAVVKEKEQGNTRPLEQFDALYRYILGNGHYWRSVFSDRSETADSETPPKDVVLPENPAMENTVSPKETVPPEKTAVSEETSVPERTAIPEETIPTEEPTASERTKVFEDTPILKGETAEQIREALLATAQPQNRTVLYDVFPDGDFVLAERDGKLVCFQSDGSLLTNAAAGSFLFDENGCYTTGNLSLDEAIAKLVSKYTKDTMKPLEKLKALYNFMLEKCSYRMGSLHEVGEDGWQLDDARKMIEKKYRGNCYGYAGLFRELARAVGFPAEAYSGMVKSTEGGLTPHGWVEITIDGKVYTFDPEIQYFNEKDMFMLNAKQARAWNYMRDPKEVEAYNRRYE